MTYTPLSLFLAIWLAVLTALSLAVAISPGSVGRRVALASCGLVLWTLFEYVAHRTLFHLQPRSTLGKRVIFLLHGNHHVDPQDPLRNLMPPAASLALAAIIWGALWTLLGSNANAVFFGFAAGYVAYDLTHFACHQVAGKSRVLAAIRRHHMRHHFLGQDGNYATTLILWDRVFGTLIESIRRP